MQRRAITLPLAAVLAALAPACGQIMPLEEQACPCATGWTCCNAVCVEGSCPSADDGGGPASTSTALGACSGTIALGTQLVSGGEDASSAASEQTVTGKASGSLAAGTTTGFSYATSVWPKPYGWQLDGWLLSATAGESVTFQLWSVEDAGNVPLSLVLYGPLEWGDGGTCEGGLQGSGAMAGTTLSWVAPVEGTYFAAPFHAVSETAVGLAFQGLNDADYARSFIVMNTAR